MADVSIPTPILYAQRVLLQMQNDGHLTKGPPIAIDDIARAVTVISGVEEIRFRFVDVESRSVMGMFRRFRTDHGVGSHDIAEIIVSSRLNIEQKRFVTCKEICQVFLSDLRAGRSAEPQEIEAYLAGLLEPQLLPFSPALETDRFAMFCAMEILCPFFMRESLYSDVKEGRRTVDEVARVFTIPIDIARIVFNPSYHDNVLQTIASLRTADLRIDPRSRSLSSDLQIMFQRNVEKALGENERLSPVQRNDN